MVLYGEEGSGTLKIFPIALYTSTTTETQGTDYLGTAEQNNRTRYMRCRSLWTTLPHHCNVNDSYAVRTCAIKPRMRVPPTCHSSAVLRLHCYVCRSGSHTSTKQMNALWLQQTAHEPRAVHGRTSSSEEQKRCQEDLQRHSNRLHRCVHRGLCTPSVRGGPGLDRTITAQPLYVGVVPRPHTHAHTVRLSIIREPLWQVVQH